MDEPTPRPWLRFHLSTLLLLQPLAALAIWLNCRPPVELDRQPQSIAYQYSGWPFASRGEILNIDGEPPWIGHKDEPSRPLDIADVVALRGHSRFNLIDVKLNVAFVAALLFSAGLLCELWIRRREARIGGTTKVVLIILALFLLVNNVIPGHAKLASPTEQEYFIGGISRWGELRSFGFPFYYSDDLNLTRHLEVWHKNLAFAFVTLTLTGLFVEFMIRAFVRFSANVVSTSDDDDGARV